MTTSDGHQAERPTKLSQGQTLLIAAGAVFWPWNVVAQNPQEIVRPGRVIALTTVLFLVAWGIAAVAARRGGRPSTVAMTSFIWLALFMVGGRLIRESGQLLGWTLVIAVAAGFPILVSRLESHVVPLSLVVGVTVASLTGPALATIQAVANWGDSEVLETTLPPVSLNQRPDIVVLILDGHPGRLAWSQDFPNDEAPIFEGLAERGFTTPESAWTPYWTTHYSLPAMLNMEYPLEKQPMNRATDSHLYRIVSGDNSLVRILQDNDYRLSVVGSGWSGLSCIQAFDVCHDSPLLDDVIFFMLHDSLVGSALVANFGHAYTHGTSSAMTRLPSMVKAVGGNGEPDLLLAHLIAPHPPTFLNSTCDTEVTAERVAVASGPWAVDPATWDPLFVDQVKCVDEFVLDTVDEIADGTLVVVVSDHGTDRRGQSVGGGWTFEASTERLNVLLAIRSESCVFPEPVILVNVFRRVLSCLSNGQLPDLDPVLFENPVVAIPNEMTSRLLASSLRASRVAR